ncbi:hypothetical protein [Streptomyces griseorubiginosus]|uniref:hypothetical protein n=1 Tax=Streptomyces griseorubiginosus TaxID=67304 RepID=UPI0036EB7AC1
MTADWDLEVGGVGAWLRRGRDRGRVVAGDVTPDRDLEVGRVGDVTGAGWWPGTSPLTGTWR